MIKIELNNAIKEKNLFLHKKYIQETVCTRLEERLYKEDQNEIADRYFVFLKSLFGKTKQEGKQRISDFCVSDDLEKLIQIFENKFYAYYKFQYRQSKSDIQKEIVSGIKNIFDDILNYKSFNTGRKVKESNGNKISWNRHTYVVNTGVKVCPYCNRQYITSYIPEGESEKTTADVDHYFSQSLYPYLQMNIYNMIPSCNVCNSKTKGPADKRHLNPYQDDSNSLVFEIPLNSIDTLYSLNVKKICVNDKDNQKAKISKEVFKLEEIYQVHISDVKKLLNNVKEYEAFREKYYIRTMGIDIGNIFHIWFDFLDRNPLEEPLIKLKQDIYKQLIDADGRTD